MGIFSAIGHIINVAKVVANTASTILGALPTVNEDAALYCEELDATFTPHAKYTVFHPNKRMIGKVTDISDDGGVDDDEVSFVLGMSNGQNMIQATNNSDLLHYFTFNHTDAKGTLYSTCVPVKPGTSMDVTNNMKTFALGNVVVSPQRISNSVTIPSSPPATPTSPSASRSLFSRKGRKSTDDLQALSLRDGDSSTQSTVLGTAGFATIVSGSIFYLYNTPTDSITIMWNADNSGTPGSYYAMSSFTVTNNTEFTLTISATIAWSNPASTSTVDVLVQPNSSGTGNIPSTEGPVTSACVAAIAEDSDGTIATKITKGLMQQAATKGLHPYVAKASHKQSRKSNGGGGGGGGGAGVDVSALTDSQRRALVAAAPLIASCGLDENVLSPAVLKAARLVGGTPQAVNRAVRSINAYYDY